MNTSMKMNAGRIGLALAATLSLATPASAAAPYSYKFEAVGQPSGITLTIRLVDETSGQPVSDAHVFAIHRQWFPMKGEPRFLDRRIALAPNGNGTFTYESNDVQTGVTIRFVAQIDNKDSNIWGSVRVGT